MSSATYIHAGMFSTPCCIQSDMMLGIDGYDNLLYAIPFKLASCIQLTQTPAVPRTVQIQLHHTGAGDTILPLIIVSMYQP